MAPSQEPSRERPDKLSGLTTRESVELFQDAHDKAVDEAHSTLQQSLTGVENASETVKPKLTLDLRKRNLSQIPKEVVAIIGQDVERYEPSSWPLHLRAFLFSFFFLHQCKLNSKTSFMLSFDCYRLQLAHNQLSHIAYEFTGCSALRYLNLRDNRFRQVPKAVS